MIGDLGAIVRLGLEDCLIEEGFEVTASQPSEGGMLSRVAASDPDAVVIDLDAMDVLQVAVQIQSEYPAVTVIACSSVTSTMRVFPADRGGEWYEADLSSGALAAAVQGTTRG
jgi:DNA-binding NarL/FixJ family response regulator